MGCGNPSSWRRQDGHLKRARGGFAFGCELKALERARDLHASSRPRHFFSVYLRHTNNFACKKRVDRDTASQLSVKERLLPVCGSAPPHRAQPRAPRCVTARAALRRTHTAAASRRPHPTARFALAGSVRRSIESGTSRSYGLGRTPRAQGSLLP